VVSNDNFESDTVGDDPLAVFGGVGIVNSNIFFKLLHLDFMLTNKFIVNERREHS
jgi:hypothetical protein